jgi:predicted TIM-barrel fold metal-dependent hydrolase
MREANESTRGQANGQANGDETRQVAQRAGQALSPRCSRRTALRAGAAIASGLVVAGEAHLVGADAKSEGFIDAHVHVWTPDLQRYPLASGYRREDMRPASFTPEELMTHAAPCGVDRVVLIQMSYYQYDNRYMLDVIAKEPRVYRGVAIVDPADRPAERMRELAKHGVRGFRIQPDGQKPDRWLDTDAMRAMWKCGGDEGLAMCHLIDASFLPSVDRMCRQFPRTPVVIDHFARIGVDGQMRAADLDNLCRLVEHPQVTVKTSAFYALGKKCEPYQDLGPMIERLLRTFGAERLMWASDCPFQVDPGHSYRASIDLLREGLGFLTQEDREWLLRKTAARVFFS